MIQILIDGRRAVIPDDLSFDYIAENRAFSNRDDYSLSISLPLAGVPENIAIFGYLNRPDQEIQKIRLDCVIQTERFSLRGVATIVDIDRKSVNIQFLKGRSAQNFDDTLEETKINELDLGSYKDRIDAAHMSPYSGWRRVDGRNVNECCIPWVSDESGIKYNAVVREGSAWKYDTETISLQWMPSLLSIAKRIAAAIGFSADFSAWEQSPLAALISCNVLPPSWEIYDYAPTMPDWSVKEFFENLEPLLAGEFDIDPATSTIVFRFTDVAEDEAGVVYIPDPVDEFSVDVSADEISADYGPVMNIRYEDTDHRMSKYYDCEWYVRKYRDSDILKFDTMQKLLSEAVKYKKTHVFNSSDSRSKKLPTNHLMYCAETDSFFGIKAINCESKLYVYGDKKYLGWVYTNILQPLNRFGEILRSKDPDDEFLDVKLIPVCIDDADGPTPFIRFSQWDGVENPETQFEGCVEEGVFHDVPDELRQNPYMSAIRDGDRDADSYFSSVSVAFWPGYIPKLHDTAIQPVIDSFAMSGPFSWVDLSDLGMSLRLRDIQRKSSLKKIDPVRKFKFSLLTKSIPSPRALYIIRGKRFVCHKLTAKFTVDGMSELIQGEFYRIPD